MKLFKKTPNIGKEVLEREIQKSIVVTEQKQKERFSFFKKKDKFTSSKISLGISTADTIIIPRDVVDEGRIDDSNSDAELENPQDEWANIFSEKEEEHLKKVEDKWNAQDTTKLYEEYDQLQKDYEAKPSQEIVKRMEVISELLDPKRKPQRLPEVRHFSKEGLIQKLTKEEPAKQIIEEPKKYKGFSFSLLRRKKSSKEKKKLSKIEVFCPNCKHMLKAHHKKGRDTGCRGGSQRVCGCLCTCQQILEANRIIIDEIEDVTKHKAITDSKLCKCNHKANVHTNENQFCVVEGCECLEFVELTEENKTRPKKEGMGAV